MTLDEKALLEGLEVLMASTPAERRERDLWVVVEYLLAGEVQVAEVQAAFYSDHGPQKPHQLHQLHRLRWGKYLLG